MSDGAAPTRAECLAGLRALIGRGEAEGFGAAQDLLLRHALGRTDAARRAAAMDELRADLARDDTAGGTPAQLAFRAALTAMIERTRLTLAGRETEVG